MSDSTVPADGDYKAPAATARAALSPGAPTSDGVVTQTEAAMTSDLLDEPITMQFTIKGAALAKREPPASAPEAIAAADDPGTLAPSAADNDPRSQSPRSPHTTAKVKIGLKAAVANKKGAGPLAGLLKAPASPPKAKKANPLSIKKVVVEAAASEPAKPKSTRAEPVTIPSHDVEQSQDSKSSETRVLQSADAQSEAAWARIRLPPDAEPEDGELLEEGPPRPPEMTSLPAKPTWAESSSLRQAGSFASSSNEVSNYPPPRPLMSGSVGHTAMMKDVDGRLVEDITEKPITIDETITMSQDPAMVMERVRPGTQSLRRSIRDSLKVGIETSGGLGSQQRPDLIELEDRAIIIPTAVGKDIAVRVANEREIVIEAATASGEGRTETVATKKNEWAATGMPANVRTGPQTTNADAAPVIRATIANIRRGDNQRARYLEHLSPIGRTTPHDLPPPAPPPRSPSPRGRRDDFPAIKGNGQDLSGARGLHAGRNYARENGYQAGGSGHAQRPETPSAPLPPRHAGASQPASPSRNQSRTAEPTPSSRLPTQGRKSTHVPGEETRRFAPLAIDAYEDSWLTQQPDLGENQSDELNEVIPEEQRQAALIAIQERSFVGASSIEEYELQEMLGEGTFGIVWKGIRGRQQVGPLERGDIQQKEELLVERGLRVRHGDVVALKQIILHNESDGMPITSLREIRLLKSLDHPNVVPVVDIALDKGNAETMSPSKTYMVFPYMDHDLAGLLENVQVKLLPAHIKQYARQLLFGTAYLHANGILHRDMKAANLLLNNEGRLMIADFGLARSIERAEQRQKYTGCVVTRWYRPPELLLGETRYHTPVDMWGVGCIIAEMFTRKPIFPGASDLDQADKIFSLCGTPSEQTMPGFKDWPKYPEKQEWLDRRRTIKVEAQGWANGSEEFGRLIEQLLELNPAKRLTAREALDHEWFWVDPLPCDPADLPKHVPSKEYDRRKRANEEAAKDHMQRQQQRQQQQQRPVGIVPPRPSVVPVPAGFGTAAPPPPPLQQQPVYAGMPPGFNGPGGGMYAQPGSHSMQHPNGRGQAPFMSGRGPAPGQYMEGPSFMPQMQASNPYASKKVDVFEMMNNRPGVKPRGGPRFKPDAINLDSAPNGARGPGQNGTRPSRQDPDQPAGGPSADPPLQY
ncbi:serine/threonine protein kinase, CMGC, CDC2/CDK sub [Microbotryomycetes sp. JL201]|nr:serine/threonine protein kinase, CMGC, CDC2/CDK sub [Microbotryomycetes sp. JL201]